MTFRVVALVAIFRTTILVPYLSHVTETVCGSRGAESLMSHSDLAK